MAILAVSGHKSINNSSLQAKIIGIVLLCICLQVGSSLHFHQQSTPQDPNLYNQDVYYSQISGIQARFKYDIDAINNKFASINLNLANTNISSSDKIILLQETLANERDALYNVQTYLNVPFALRSCQCVNVTQQQKQNLSVQIQNVSNSIQNLQSLVSTDKNGSIYQNPKCPQGKCAAVQYIQKQIDQMTNYVKIMNDTVTSQCCKVVNYVYIDNLVDSNTWIYGNTTEQQYRITIFNKSQNANISKCGRNSPFANFTTNQCFACPSNTIFNVQSRLCQSSCQSKNLILDLNQHQCDYNRTCVQGLIFSNSTLKCQILQGTASNCPKSKPVWNQNTLSCVGCPDSSPYFDPLLAACRPCTNNEVFQNYTGQGSCIDKSLILLNCPDGTYYDLTSQSCLLTPTPNHPPIKNPNTTQPTNPNPSSTIPTNPTNQTNPNSGTFSQCPPTTPFWSSSDFSCSKCPLNTPYFDVNTNQCQTCPINSIWNLNSNSCISNITQPSTTSCPHGQIYDKASQNCVTSVYNCPPNSVFNSATNKCQTINQGGQIGMCPPSTPFWNSNNLNCQQCNQTAPFFNKTVNTCQKCPNNTEWNAPSSTCISTVVICRAGLVLNTTTNTCQAIVCTNSTPILNHITNQCEGCPDGTIYNPVSTICDFNSSSLSRTNTSICPPNLPYWNNQKLSCDICPAGYSQDPNTKTCVLASSRTPSHQESVATAWSKTHQAINVFNQHQQTRQSQHTIAMRLKS